MLTIRVMLSGAIMALSVSAASAEEENLTTDSGSLIEAIRNGKPIVDVRYRFETKDQDGFAKDAVANTVRTRLGFETAEFHHLKVLVELENVFSIGNDKFNSTTNGKTQFPVIADPDATELNRAQVTFTGIDKTSITLGRQRFNLNNHRFVGAVDFRQNQQTFDAVRLSSTAIDKLTVDYLYIGQVHRIFGDDHRRGDFDSDSHVVSAVYDAGSIGAIKGYGVFLDLEEVPALSSATWGVRYENSFDLNEDAGVTLHIVAEYAKQKDYATNPFDYSESYIHGALGLKAKPVSALLGYEQLGGNGAIGFSTPLATLHKFQGFADVFLTTPTMGIEDVYGKITYSWADGPFGAGLTFHATYHDFSSEQGGINFGDEIDLGVNIKFQKNWSAEIKGAIYDGASAFSDGNILWASLRFQF